MKRINWECSCGERFVSRDAAWKHPFNSKHVIRDREEVREPSKDERNRKGPVKPDKP
jgi:hypothetical protein